MMEAVRSDKFWMYFEGAPTCVLMTAYEGNEVQMMPQCFWPEQQRGGLALN